MYKCECNTEMIWQNDFMWEDYCVDGDGIVTVYYCPKCESMHSIFVDMDGEVVRILAQSEDEDEREIEF